MAKKTRIMKVTMDEEEFRKFDLGITHSDKGIRTEDGKLSSLPDIASVDPSEYTNDLFSEQSLDYSYGLKESSEQDKQQSDWEALAEAISELAQTVSKLARESPEVIRGTIILGKKVKSAVSYGYSRLSSRIKWLPSKHYLDTNVDKGPDFASEVTTNEELEIIPKFVIQGENGQTIKLTKKDAEKLLANMRSHARQLAIMMYAWGNISIKDEKTEEEYRIEQDCILQLLNDDCRKTIQMLVTNRQLLDESTAKTLADYLDGYLNSEKGLVAIPAKPVQQTKHDHLYF